MIIIITTTKITFLTQLVPTWLRLVIYLEIHSKLSQLAKLLIQSHQVLHCVDEGALGLCKRFVQLQGEEERKKQLQKALVHNLKKMNVSLPGPTCGSGLDKSWSGTVRWSSSYW